MTKKKVIFSMIGSLIFIWMVATAYFYAQHQIQVERITINEYVELDEYSIYLKDVEKYNFERKYRRGGYRIYELGLPDKLVYWIYKVQSFYSVPYEIRDENYTYKLNCEIIFKEQVQDSNRQFDRLSRELDMELYEDGEKAIGHTGGSGSGYREGMNVINFYLKHEVNSTNSDELRLINDAGELILKVELDGDAQIKQYDYFHRQMNTRDNIEDSLDGILSALRYDHMELAQTYIHGSYGDKIPLDRINIDRIVDLDYDQIEYKVVKGVGRDDFLVKVMDTQENEVLELAIVYDNYEWWITGME